MRVTGSIKYETEHGNHGVRILATWDVPYAAWTKGDVIEEVEVSGEVQLRKLQLFAGIIGRELTLPVGPMLAEFVKAYEESTAGCESELADMFCDDLRSKRDYYREEKYERQREERYR